MPLRARGIVVDLNVPPINNSANVLVKDVIGNREDDNDSTTLAGRIRDQWEETHVGQLVYPTLAQGILVTAHLDAWTLGSYVTIIPVNTITGDFHIHHICVCSASANGAYELRLYRGVERLAIVTFTRTDKKDDIAGLDIYTPHIEANSQIRDKLASSNAAQEDTVRISIWYHLHE